MATPMQVRGADVKVMSIWAWLGLTLITFGIYQLFWYYRVNREMRDIGRAWGDEALGSTSPGLSLLAYVIPIANFVTFHKTGRRIQAVQSNFGRTPDYSMAVHWILLLFTGLWPMYSQSVLNGLWETAPVDGGAAMPAPTVATPVG